MKTKGLETDFSPPKAVRLMKRNPLTANCGKLVFGVQTVRPRMRQIAGGRPQKRSALAINRVSQNQVFWGYVDEVSAVRQRG
jgi:hypothetical protein